MHRTTRAVIGATTASAVLIGGATSAGAATANVGTSGWTAQVTVPDWTWTTTSGCEDVPVTLTADGWGADAIVVDLDARHIQSGSSSGSAFDYWYTSAPNTVDDYEFSTGMQLCPFKTPAGTYEVTGTVEYGWSTDYDPYYGTPAPGTLEGDVYTTFVVARMPSATRLDPISPTSTPDEVHISGRITATSSVLGVVGVPFAQGSIQQFVNGGWTHLGSVFADSLGYYRTYGYNITAATPIRVVFEGTEKVDASTSAPVTPSVPVPQPPVTTPPTTPEPPATLPTPTVKVKTIGGASKFRVDVDPNKGSGYWRFQVQKKKSNGSWVKVKTYKTLGSKERRTVNLKKGTYRVVVLPKYGYGIGVSDEVYLKR